MSLFTRKPKAPFQEPDPAQDAADEWLAEVTPEQIEAEELRQSIAFVREMIEIAEANAKRYDGKGEPVKAAVERRRAADDRIRLARYEAHLRTLTGEVA